MVKNARAERKKKPCLKFTNHGSTQNANRAAEYIRLRNRLKHQPSTDGVAALRVKARQHKKLIKQEAREQRKALHRSIATSFHENVDLC